ncbi:MAG: DNA-binding response regulator [Acidobacteria bacterium]|nr:MAG: DNA-binding response regulator [Acidobacteriota bacterium]
MAHDNVMRDGLARLLEAEPDRVVVGEAERAVNEALKTGVFAQRGEATRVITADMPEVRVIGLCMFDEAERAQTMLAAGAAGYLRKSSQASGACAGSGN